ncbi:MAG: exodeoxyribonuclease III [Thermoleophilaceae bacterium]|nr:exodeoxyribonuclease III [Thermoleophilaceae bacterium]
MKLATWNVNSLKVRLPRVLEFLDRHRPDVLCLQETKCAGTDFPHAAFEEAGYAAVEHSAGRWAGVAIAAPVHTPLGEVHRGLPGEAVTAEARYVEASVGGLRVASAYVPNGRAVGSPAFVEKLRFLDALAERAPVLDALLGDLNVTRADLDVYDPIAFLGSTHVTPDERGRLEAILDAGLTDAFRALQPEEVGFTWWDYRQGHFHRGMGLRIDYVMLGSEHPGRLTSCAIDRDFRKGPKPSDHAPLLAELGDPG